MRKLEGKTIVKCDADSCAFSISGACVPYLTAVRSTDASEVSAKLEAAGWSVVDGRDICPVCARASQ